MHVRARIAGGKTGLAESATVTSGYASLWRFGTGAIPSLKSVCIGLTGNEGNHGEDVKEYYFYLDSTPTHSYMKFLYKYPQGGLPVRAARRRKSEAKKTRPGIRVAGHGRVQ